MKTVMKLAYKNITYDIKRTLFTLLCVILSVSIIAIALCLSASVLNNVDFEGDAANIPQPKACVPYSPRQRSS